MADALGMAMDIALFTPSATGSTAFDRLARARRLSEAGEADALQAVRRAQFRLLRVETVWGNDTVQLRDITSGEGLHVLDENIPSEAVGVALLGRLTPLGDGPYVFVGGITPLDEVALEVAMGFVRPGAGRGLINPHRCAEAVYRHVLRHGTLEIPGLNRPLEGGDEDLEEGGALDQLAQRWAEPDASHDPEDIQFVREQVSLDGVVDLLASVANTRTHGFGALSGAYAAIALLQLETLYRRALAGSGAIGLETVAAAVQSAIAAGEIPPGTHAVFVELRSRLGIACAAPAAKDAELDRLIGRIQALRAKTVEQGCTEQEALAAAEKVAELLDRYGLSLSELDLKQQACEGASIETERRRAGPVDDCVPAVAAFFDCRVWGEKSASGRLRYVFFGLPADVTAARYLYDLVEHAFETEATRFRAGPSYQEAPSGLRRTLTNSFQIGLGRGITAKLHRLREAREPALRTSTGRDLVVAKADVVDAELAKLGLHLRARSRSTGKRVLRAAFEAGHHAGLGFEYTPGVAHG